MLKNNPKLQAKDIEAMSRVLSSVPKSLTKQMMKENKKTDIEKIFDKGKKNNNIKKPKSKK
jgi:hypothetical protein